MEGATEKVFYRSFLKWIADKNQCSFEKGEDLENGDIYFVLVDLLIKPQYAVNNSAENP